MDQVSEICREELTVYHFSGELRRPTIKVAASDKWSAMAWYSKKYGPRDVEPRCEVPFDAEKHLNTVEIAENDMDSLADYPPVLEARPKRGDRRRYGDADPDEFPLLQHFSRGSITPEWVIDRRTGKVEISGEFESFPAYFLDQSEKPSLDQVFSAGGRLNVGGNLDLQAEFLNEVQPWLRIEDGEDLRNRLLDEIDRYERKMK